LTQLPRQVLMIRTTMDDINQTAHKLVRHPRLECEELPFDGVQLSMLRELPKIDLHRHLVGSIRPEVLTHIADKLNVRIPVFGNDPEKIRRSSVLRSPLLGGYKAFLQKRIWGVFQHIFQHPRGCANAVYWAIADASDDNVVYVEFRVSPYGISPGFSIDLATFIKSLAAGVSAAARNYPQTLAKIILSIGRKTVYGKWQPENRSRYYDSLVAVASDYREIIAGFDLSGDEEEYPNELFTELAHKVKAKGFSFTVHAGETGDPNSIWTALNDLGADRIGHGIGAARDEALVQKLQAANIPIEICPTSNWLIGLVPSIEAHPFGDLYRRGVLLTINTDDPVIFGDTTLSLEFYRLLKAGHITLEDILRLQKNSANAIFAEQSVKENLLKTIERTSIEPHVTFAG